MRNVRIFTAVALAGIAAGCAYRGGTPDTNLAPGAQWTATIVQTTASAIHGTVTFVRTEPQNQTRVIFALSAACWRAVPSPRLSALCAMLATQ